MDMENETKLKAYDDEDGDEYDDVDEDDE